MCQIGVHQLLHYKCPDILTVSQTQQEFGYWFGNGWKERDGEKIYSK